MKYRQVLSSILHCCYIGISSDLNYLKSKCLRNASQLMKETSSNYSRNVYSSPSAGRARMDLLLLWLPSAFLLEHEWEHGDHGDHSLMTQSIAQGISQATTSGRGSSEQRWCGTSSPAINKARQTWRKAQLGSISTASLKQPNFMSNICLSVQEYTTQKTSWVKLEAWKNNTWTTNSMCFKLSVWHFGCSSLYKANRNEVTQ